MTDDPQNPVDFLPPAIRPPDALERAADIATFASELGAATLSLTGEPLGIAASVVVWALGYMTGGYADGRKFNRYAEAVGVINERVTTLEGKSAEYVRTVDFADLLEETLERIGRERHIDKRKMYAAFLADKMLQPDTTYDEDLRVLQILDQIGYTHLEIIRYLLNRFPLQPPPPNPNETVFAYLSNKRADWFKEPKNEAFNELRTWRIIDPNFGMPLGMVRESIHLFTVRGRRLVNYLSP